MLVVESSPPQLSMHTGLYIWNNILDELTPLPTSQRPRLSDIETPSCVACGKKFSAKDSPYHNGSYIVIMSIWSCHSGSTLAKGRSFGRFNSCWRDCMSLNPGDDEGLAGISWAGSWFWRGNLC